MKITFKIKDITFEVKTITRVKKCPMCNGKRQIMDYFLGVKDGCNLCDGTGEFVGTLLSCIEDPSPKVFSFEKHFDKSDWSKILLAQTLCTNLEKVFEFKKEPYEEMSSYERLKIIENKIKELKDSRLC